MTDDELRPLDLLEDVTFDVHRPTPYGGPIEITMEQYLVKWIDILAGEGQSAEEWIQKHADMSAIDDENPRDAVYLRAMEADRDLLHVEQVDVDIPPRIWDLIRLRTKLSIAQGKHPADAIQDVQYEYIELHANLIVNDEVMNWEDVVADDENGDGEVGEAIEGP